MPFRRNI